MIVEADSWHMCRCRAYYGWDYQPANLCRHFWKTIWTIIGAGIMVLLGLVFIAWAILLVWLVFRNPWLLIFVGVGAAIGMIGMITIYAEKRKQARPPKEKADPRNSGFFSSWLKAKKGRYCPLIEVKGEEIWKTPYETNLSRKEDGDLA